jgi:hypothetical protein
MFPEIDLEFSKSLRKIAEIPQPQNVLIQKKKRPKNTIFK